MRQPWYREGLKFACVGCGDCCTGAPGYVWVDRSEIEALAAAVGMEIEAFERRFVRTVGNRKSLIEHDNGDCVFFDGAGRGCRVYEVRPRQCRTWPFWPSNPSSRAAWEEIASRCRGCNSGRLASLQEILVNLEK
jgi:uncharacterized protein